MPAINQLTADAQELATALLDGQGMDALEVIFGGAYTDGPAMARLLHATANTMETR